jgi:hypothetical protein
VTLHGLWPPTETDVSETFVQKLNVVLRAGQGASNDITTSIKVTSLQDGKDIESFG